MSTAVSPERELRESPAYTAPADSLPAWLKLTRQHVLFAILFAALYWYLAWLPLWHSDLWLHVKIGEWIWTHGRLPTADVFLPLSEGVRYIDDAWLSQLIFYGVHSAAGLEGLSLVYAVTVALVFAFLFTAGWSATGRVWPSILALVALLPILWPNLMPIRPQMFGGLLFVVLLTLVGRRWHGANWFVVPLIVGLWTNLHSSFVIGLIVLACTVVGRAIDVWRDSRRVAATLRDADVRRWFLVSELAFAACLVNPYGLELLHTVLTFGDCPNLRDMVEWQPLSVRSWDGVGFFASIVALIWLMRTSRRPLAATEAFLLAVFVLACLPHQRFTYWWGLFVPFVFLPHVAGIIDRWLPRRATAQPRSLKHTLVAAVACWVIFAYSAPGNALVHHRPRRLEGGVSRLTPVETANFLCEHPPRGQVFNPMEWGDWLTWYGPPDIQCVANSHVHLLPEEIWQAYQRVVETRTGWEETLDLLGTTTIVIDRERHKGLLTAISESAKWRIVHEDRLAVVAERVGGRAETHIDKADGCDPGTPRPTSEKGIGT